MVAQLRTNHSTQAAPEAVRFRPWMATSVDGAPEDGAIAVTAGGGGAIVIESVLVVLTRAVVHARADMVPHPRAARSYRNLLLDTGFTDVAVEVHTGIFTDTTMLPMLTGFAAAASSTGTITPEQAAAWTAEQIHRAQGGRLFLAIPMFLASARRP
jgi:hypothetical protein